MTASAQPSPRHFLNLDEIAPAELRAILEASKALKARFKAGERTAPLAGRSLAMIFEKPSTRTRVSFELAITQLGGHAVVLRPDEMQLKRGETVADTAQVLSRYVDAIMIRTGAEQKLLELAQFARAPVINGLTDRSHPCQIMADIMTFEEWRGPIAGRTVAWCGDANNVCASWIHAAGQLGFKLRIACPDELAPAPDLIEWAAATKADVVVSRDPIAAVTGADLVTTDTWVSMGHESANRHALLTPYRVDEALMAQANPGALFMHCLPAHRGEEVTDAVMDGPCSAVFDEAENRLHVQKGVLLWCLNGQA